MWRASLLLAAVRADFDADLVAAGQRGQRRAHKAGPALLDVLRVPVRTGCALTYAAGNRTLTFRGARRITFDPAQDCDGAWPGCGAGAPRTPLLCSLGDDGASRPPRRAPLALATSVTDFRFLWRFWRWTANTACYASQHDLPYYVFVGTPLKRATKRSAATTCPARKEELLGHTSKALSLHALAALGVADRVLFLDADIWIARHVPLRAFLEAAGASDTDVVKRCGCTIHFRPYAFCDVCFQWAKDPGGDPPHCRGIAAARRMLIDTPGVRSDLSYRQADSNRVCAVCTEVANKVCRCKSVRYCSETCQRAHWKEHKAQCKR